MRAAASCKTLSPAGWPCVSFTCLKWSRSTKTTEHAVPERRERSSSLEHRPGLLSILGQEDLVSPADERAVEQVACEARILGEEDLHRRGRGINVCEVLDGTVNGRRP